MDQDDLNKNWNNLNSMEQELQKEIQGHNSDLKKKKPLSEQLLDAEVEFYGITNQQVKDLYKEPANKNLSTPCD